MYMQLNSAQFDLLKSNKIQHYSTVLYSYCKPIQSSSIPLYSLHSIVQFSVGKKRGPGLCTEYVFEILLSVVVQAFDLNLVKPVH